MSEMNMNNWKREHAKWMRWINTIRSCKSVQALRRRWEKDTSQVSGFCAEYADWDARKPCKACPLYPRFCGHRKAVMQQIVVLMESCDVPNLTKMLELSDEILAEVDKHDPKSKGVLVMPEMSMVNWKSSHDKWSKWLKQLEKHGADASTDYWDDNMRCCCGFCEEFLRDDSATGTSCKACPLFPKICSDNNRLFDVFHRLDAEMDSLYVPRDRVVMSLSKKMLAAIDKCKPKPVRKSAKKASRG